MCGILGLFSSDGIEGIGHMLQNANDLVSYRGPDAAGFALLSSRSSEKCTTMFAGQMPLDANLSKVDLVLGHRRLAIIDLSPSGHQPMSTRDGSLCITYNGEIYNYLELRTELEQIGHSFLSHSDTEVILHAYEEWGENCVSRFNGMWAFAISDISRKRLFCSRDRFGVKPFHYFFDGKHFAFGSEIKQLLCFSFVPKAINRQMVYEYLAFGAVEHSDQSFFSSISKLKPGYNLVLDMTGPAVKVNRYYDPSFSIDKQIAPDQAADRLRELLTDSVRLRLRSDVRVGSCLSGGLDSSSIVCLMNRLLLHENHGEVQHTFSSHFDEEEANEIEYMKEVIDTTGVTAHYVYPTVDDFSSDLDHLVWHQEEPFGSTSIFAQWSVFKSVHQQGIKVMLDGQGADELLGGYQPLGYGFLSELLAKGHFLTYVKEGWHQNRKQGKSLPTLATQPFVMLMPRGVKSLADRLRRKLPGYLPHATQWIAPELARHYSSTSPYLSNQEQRSFNKPEVLSNMLYQLTFFNNLQALLKYEDRDSMAFSVEGRVPFLDYRLVEFVFGLPSALKINKGYTKRVLRDSMEGILPEKVQWRISKLGFATPEHAWQRSILRPLIREAIGDRRLHEFVVPKKASEFLEILDKSRQRDFTPWLWVNLVLWMNAYGLEP